VRLAERECRFVTARRPAPRIVAVTLGLALAALSVWLARVMAG
jgi:hypothetical protein